MGLQQLHRLVHRVVDAFARSLPHLRNGRCSQQVLLGQGVLLARHLAKVNHRSPRLPPLVGQDVQGQVISRLARRPGVRLRSDPVAIALRINGKLPLRQGSAEIDVQVAPVRIVGDKRFFHKDIFLLPHVDADRTFSRRQLHHGLARLARVVRFEHAQRHLLTAAPSALRRHLQPIGIGARAPTVRSRKRQGVNGARFRADGNLPVGRIIDYDTSTRLFVRTRTN